MGVLSTHAITGNCSTRSRAIEADPHEMSALSTRNNAATSWRKAFTLIHELNPCESEILRRHLFFDPHLEPLPTDDEISAVLERIAPIIALLREGAIKPGCDWGARPLSSLEGFSEQSNVLFLASIACFEASERIHTQPAEAAEDLKALQHLGNTVNQTVSGALSISAVQEEIFSFMSHHTDSFPDAIRADLKSTILNQTALVNAFQECFQTLSCVDNQGTTDDLRKSAMVSQMLWMSDEEFERWKTSFSAEHPTVEGEYDASDLGIFTKARVRARESIVHKTMCLAALSMKDEGLSALNHYPDPFTGKAFSYSDTGKSGFLLPSQVYHGRPIMRSFYIQKSE
jgi:hypothetical protein